MSNDIPKPVLKWVGGKNQIMPDIMKTFPESFVDYHEPFVGGGSVLLSFLTHVRNNKIRISGTVYASDLNEKLIHLYKNIQKDCSRVSQELDELVREYENCKGTVINRKATTIDEARTSQESYFYWVRHSYNEMSRDERCSPRGTAAFIFLNKTCFRGVYREGPKGFNVPFGHYKNPSIYDAAHLREVSGLIRDVVFRHASFSDSLQHIRPGSFVYMDPPYAPVNSASFVGYTEDGFNEEKHKQLFKLCNDMAETGVSLVMSNADVEFVRKNFPEERFKTDVVSCRRAINSKNPASRANEVIIQSLVDPVV